MSTRYTYPATRISEIKAIIQENIFKVRAVFCMKPMLIGVVTKQKRNAWILSQ